MRKTVRERRGKEECCHVITVDPKINWNWNVHCPEKMEMWIKKRALPSLSLSLLLLSLSSSFFCSLSPLLSLSPMLTFSTLSHTNTPAFTRHHRIQRHEGERNLQSPEKNVNIQEEKRKCAKLSLSHFPALLFLILFFTFSLSSLSSLF